LDVAKVSLVGTSLGAWLGLEIAVMEPRRVTSLTAISPVGVKLNGRDQRSFAEIIVENPQTVRSLLYADAASDPWLDDSDPDVKLAKAQTREAFMHYAWEPYLHNPLLPDLLPRIQVPALVVDGESDGVAPAGYYDQLAARISASRHTISGAGHYPDVEQPEATSAVVAKFISEAEAADLSQQEKEVV
jgi:pimeloyl-ACP methyl ester carboxylesterase